MGFVRRRARRRTALVVGGAAYAVGRHQGGQQESDDGGYDEPPPEAAPAPAEPSATIDYDELAAAREAARRRHPDRRGVRGRQGQDPRNLTHAIAAMRSRLPEPTGGLPELVVEDSPDAADLALLEEQVAAAAIAAAGLGEEQEFGIFARETTVASWRASPPSSGAGIASCRRCGSRNRCAIVGWRTHSSPARRPRRAAEAARSSCFTPTTYSLAVSTSGSDTRRSGSSRTARREALRAGTARSCEAPSDAACRARTSSVSSGAGSSATEVREDAEQ